MAATEILLTLTDCGYRYASLQVTSGQDPSRNQLTKTEPARAPVHPATSWLHGHSIQHQRQNGLGKEE